MVSTRFEHDWCSIFVPLDALASDGNVVESSPGSEKLICRVTPPNEQIAYRVRSLVDQVITTAGDYSQFESSPAASAAKAELLELTRLIVRKQPVNGPAKDGRPRIPRNEIIRRCKIC